MVDLEPRLDLESTPLALVLPFAPGDLENFLGDVLQVENLRRAILANAAELLNPPHRLAAVHGSLADHIEARHEVRLLDLHEKELRAAENDPEVVVEVV